MDRLGGDGREAAELFGGEIADVGVACQVTQAVENGHLVGRFDARTAAHAGQAETLVGVGTRDEDFHTPAQRQHAAFVAKQYDAFFGQLQGCRLMFRSIDAGPGGDVAAVECADAVVDAQDAADLVVNDAFGYAAVAYRVEQGPSEAALFAARHRNVESRQRRFFGRTGLEPVGDDESVESPLLFEDVGQQAAAVAHELAVHAVCRGHDAPQSAFADGRFIGREVDFMQGAVADCGHVEVAVVLAVVAGVMLEAGGHLFALDTFHGGGRDAAVQVRVFGVVFEEAAAQRIAQDVVGGTQQYAPADGPGFAAHYSAGLFGQCGVPRRAPCDSRRKCRGGAADVGSAGTVAALHFGDSEPRNALKRHAGRGSGAHGDFLFEGHQPQQAVDFTFGCRIASRTRRGAQYGETEQDAGE